MVYGGYYDAYPEAEPTSLGTFAEVIGDGEIDVVRISHYDRASGYDGTIRDLTQPAVITFVFGEEVYHVKIPREWIR